MDRPFDVMVRLGRTISINTMVRVMVRSSRTMTGSGESMPTRIGITPRHCEEQRGAPGLTGVSNLPVPTDGDCFASLAMTTEALERDRLRLTSTSNVNR